MLKKKKRFLPGVKPQTREAVSPCVKIESRRGKQQKQKQNKTKTKTKTKTKHKKQTTPNPNSLYPQKILLSSIPPSHPIVNRTLPLPPPPMSNRTPFPHTKQLPFPWRSHLRVPAQAWDPLCARTDCVLAGSHLGVPFLPLVAVTVEELVSHRGNSRQRHSCMCPWACFFGSFFLAAWLFLPGAGLSTSTSVRGPASTARTHTHTHTHIPPSCPRSLGTSWVLFQSQL